MCNYPNFLSLSSDDVHRIVQSVALFNFDRLYGAFPKLIGPSGGKEIIRESAERYLRAISRSVTADD